MKHTLVVMCLYLPALGQATYSGAGATLGSATYGAVQGGAPLVYNARTDNCAVGTESGCTTSTLGADGGPLIFQIRPTDTPPFAPLVPANTMATDPDSHSTLLLVTDGTIKNPNTNWNAGESGERINVDSSMFLTTFQGGGPYVFYMYPAAIRSAAGGGTACSTVANPTTNVCTLLSNIYGASPSSDTTQCKTTGVGCTHIDNQGQSSFSSVPGEGNIIYEWAGNVLTLNELAICRVGHPSDPACTATPADTFVRTVIADFTSDTPVPCSVAPPGYVVLWPGNFSSARDGSFAFVSSGGAPWVANTDYVATDDFIYPTPSHKNTAHHGFQVTVSGNSGTTEPDWDGTCATTCTVNGVTYKNIGHLGNQGQAFDVWSFGSPASNHKGCSHLNTYNGKVYRGHNEGPNWPATGTQDPSGSWTTDTDLICEPYGTNPCPLYDFTTMHEGGTNKNSEFSTFSPNASPNCLVPGECSCSTGNNYITGGWNNTTAYQTGDTVYNAALGPPYTLYKATSPVTGGSGPPNSPWTDATIACHHVTWEQNSTVMHLCITRGTINGVNGTTGHCYGHSIEGYKYLASDGYYLHLWSQPTINGSPNPHPSVYIASTTPGDQHGVYSNSGTQDTNPAGVANTDIPALTYAEVDAANPGLSSGYHEFNGLAFDGSGLVYRWAHNYSTGTEASFPNQNNESAISPDGQWALIPSDFMGTRGSKSADWVSGKSYTWGDYMYPTNASTNTLQRDYQVVSVNACTGTGGANPCTPGVAGNSGATEPLWDSCTGGLCSDGVLTWGRQPAPCNQLRGQTGPATGIALTNGELVYPVGNNGNYSVFQVTNTPVGVTGSAIPNWNNCSVYGQTCTYVMTGTGAVNAILTNINPNDCKSDVMLVDLVSAH